MAKIIELTGEARDEAISHLLANASEASEITIRIGKTYYRFQHCNASEQIFLASQRAVESQKRLDSGRCTCKVYQDFNNLDNVGIKQLERILRDNIELDIDSRRALQDRREELMR